MGPKPKVKSFAKDKGQYRVADNLGVHLGPLVYSSSLSKLNHTYNLYSPLKM